jgi:hypothetical protein
VKREGDGSRAVRVEGLPVERARRWNREIGWEKEQWKSRARGGVDEDSERQ